MDNAMKYEIISNPVGMIDFLLEKNEKITAEAGSMVYMDGDITINTKTRSGGLFKSLKTTLLAGETFFVNEYEANDNNCKIGLTGKTLGDIVSFHVDDGWIVQSGGYVASTDSLTLDTEWQGFGKGLFGSSLFMLKTVGSGEIFLNAWGAVRSIKLENDKNITIDNYQILALSPETTYEVKAAGSAKTTIFGGEGLVTEITGPGEIYYQTKNVSEFVRSLKPHLPKK